MEDKNKVLDKIRKLLKLGKNTNFDGEAHQALAAAMRLAAGIGMTIEEVKMDPENAEDKKIDTFVHSKFRTSVPQWESLLANGVAKALGCVSLVMKRWQSGRNIETICIVGTKADSELFFWLYPYIIQQLRKLCHRDWDNIGFAYSDNRKQWEKSWYIGAAVRVVEMAKDYFKENTTNDEQNQYALVVADKYKQAQNFVDQTLNVGTTRRRAQNHDGMAKHLGYQSGGEVTMGRPIEQSKREMVEA